MDTRESPAFPYAPNHAYEQDAARHYPYDDARYPPQQQQQQQQQQPQQPQQPQQTQSSQPYLARPYPTDPRYADQHGRVPVAYDVGLGAYQYPPPPTASSAGAWRAEWYPPVSSTFPLHGGPAGSAPPLGLLGQAAPPRQGLPGGGVVAGVTGVGGVPDARMRRARIGEYTNNMVYSFVPLPGAAQQKRPRRRYEEIERIYKCGWHGCEKAYGTLNHLNAHVTMQNHGPKRIPEEFKETRKEWKQRKKEEELRRKQEAEQRQAASSVAVPVAVPGQQQQQQQQQQPPPPPPYGSYPDNYYQ